MEHRRIVEPDVKTWFPPGFRMFKPIKFRWFYFKWSEDFQGGRCKALTIHLFGRCFQYVWWS